MSTEAKLLELKPLRDWQARQRAKRPVPPFEVPEYEDFASMAQWMERARDTLEAQAAELIEQARIIGMGAERELALRAEIERLIPMAKDALEKGRHRLLKEGFSPQDPTVRAMNEAIRALAH